MQLKKISAGESPPELINAVIEIPAYADPIKYEIDKASSAIFVDRFLGAPMYYPCNYGFLPSSLGEDGDPLDLLVLTPVPVIVGSVIPCRPIGVLNMDDEAGRDSKVLTVPATGMNSGYDHVNTYKDIPQATLDKIQHFFEYYKKLEPGKWVKVRDWQDEKGACEEVLAAIKRQQEQGGDA